MRLISTRSMSSSFKDAVEVFHDKPNRAFRAMSRGEELGHLEYRLLSTESRNMIDFYHTFTRPAAQGRGVAGMMVKSGLEWATKNHYAVIPSCSYVASYINKNPQWRSAL